MEKTEQKYQKGKEVLKEIIEETFWTQYRKDADIEAFKTKTEKGLGKELTEILFLSMKEYVNEFAELKNTTAKEDAIYVNNCVNKMINSVIVSHQTLIESFFKQ